MREPQENADSPTDRITSKLSRRHALAGVATMVTAAGTVVVVGEPASASVSVEEFDVSDAEFERESVTPVIDVTAAFDYDAGLESVDRLEFSLLVDGSEIDTDELVTTATANDGDTTLSGSALDSSEWSKSDFEVGVGEQTETDLSVTLEFRVIDGEGSVVVEDSASDSATIEVTHPQESTYVASVGGSGSIRAADD